ncbi:hypothetical protein Glove_51g42 [Diversispora epigaea]|uniref:Uncharacterized protein n=1 Tax=Diversispora epigaea TaxID=1348612 RepID=A0A397JK92_9GLOM|nr:hypothetical protein Glove_51g42 [Diversispora epigaea]
MTKKMWHRFRNASSSNAPKNKETKEKESCKRTLKKSVSMDSLHHLKPPTYVRKRNGSLDSNLFSNSYWFNQEKYILFSTEKNTIKDNYSLNIYSTFE